MLSSTLHPHSSWWNGRKRNLTRPPPLLLRPELEGLESRLAPSSPAALDPATALGTLRFEANLGQSAAPVNYLARGQGYSLFLTPTESVFVLRQASSTTPTDGIPALPAATVLRLQLVGSNPAALAQGQDLLAGRSNYLVGNDPSQWHTNVPSYGRVAYQDIYPGVDLVYYGSGGQLEYDFVVRPGADPGAIKLGIRGAQGTTLDGQGNLVLHLAGGTVVEHAPIVYQEVNGVRTAVAGHFVLAGDNQVGFAVGAHDARLPLVIDPVLSYSTYLGGGNDDYSYAIAVDGAGAAYITGYTRSSDFPMAGAFDASLRGDYDAFVTKLDALGGLVYSTYLGGSYGDTGNGIAVDSAGAAYVTGNTYSGNFPTTPGAFDTTINGNCDVFVTKLDALGGLAYSTFLGGSSGDIGYGIAVDGAGAAYVTGYTYSLRFPTTDGAFDVTFNGGVGADVFVTKLDLLSGLVYSTYLGGSNNEIGYGIAVDGAGAAYVGGYTVSTDFPTTAGAFDADPNGNYDAFVTKLDPLGRLAYSTYLGGSDFDKEWGIAVDGAGAVYVAGYTASTDFPTAGAFAVGYKGGRYDVFVTKLDLLSGLAYSTYLGGSSDERCYSIAVDGKGAAYVTGDTTSIDFPTTAWAYNARFNGGTDVFVTKLDALGGLAYSTYLGGGDIDTGNGIAVDGAGTAYITGDTTSTDFPTTAGAFDTTINGRADAFVTKLWPVVLELSPSTLPGGTYGAAYNQMVSASGGTGPYTFTVSAGALPAGLALESDGRLHGTLAQAGAYNFTISARDSSTDTGPYTVSHAYTVTVAKAALTVRADNKSRTYGSSNPPLTVTCIGLVNGDTPAAVYHLTVTTSATPRSNVGRYVITASGAEADNYTLSYVSGTLTVNPAVLTVRAASLSRPYLTANPPLTYSISGFVNGQTLASSGVTGKPALSTTASKWSAPGVYPIRVNLGTLAARNYVFQLVGGTLTVKKSWWPSGGWSTH